MRSLAWHQRGVEACLPCGREKLRIVRGVDEAIGVGRAAADGHDGARAAAPREIGKIARLQCRRLDHEISGSYQ